MHKQVGCRARDRFCGQIVWGNRMELMEGNDYGNQVGSCMAREWGSCLIVR